MKIKCRIRWQDSRNTKLHKWHSCNVDEYKEGVFHMRECGCKDYEEGPCALE